MYIRCCRFNNILLWWSYGRNIRGKEGALKSKKTCFDRESNTGPSDLQSDALPTELSKHDTASGHFRISVLVSWKLKTSAERQIIWKTQNPTDNDEAGKQVGSIYLPLDIAP